MAHICYVDIPGDDPSDDGDYPPNADGDYPPDDDLPPSDDGDYPPDDDYGPPISDDDPEYLSGGKCIAYELDLIYFDV